MYLSFCTPGGKVRGRNNVRIIMDKRWKNNVAGVKRIGDRVVYLKLLVSHETINIIRAYAPQVG